MRIVVESLRFTLIFLILSAILGAITYFVFSGIGINAEKYGWTAMAGGLFLSFVLYKNRGWDKVFNKKILWTSVILIFLLPLLIPDMSPTYLHTTKYAYSYGFPFKFITLYIENGTKFILPNLFTGAITGWNLSMGIFVNFILFYFSLRFIFKNLTNKTRDFENKTFL